MSEIDSIELVKSLRHQGIPLDIIIGHLVLKIHKLEQQVKELHERDEQAQYMFNLYNPDDGADALYDNAYLEPIQAIWDEERWRNAPIVEPPEDAMYNMIPNPAFDSTEVSRQQLS